jgi:hypothetical protein
MVGRVRVAIATVGAVLVFAPAAHAVPPQCPSMKFTGPKNSVISLAALTCTNVGSDFSISVNPFPAHGQLSTSPNTYTPTAGYQGPDQFKYTVTDNVTHETSAPATVDLLIDSAPTCTNLAITTAFNTPVHIADLPCTDVDDTNFDVYFDDPSHGTVDVDPATGDVVYTPAANFAGTDAFTFFGRDPWGLDSPDSTVTITVRPAPLPTVVSTPVPLPAAPPDKTAPNATLKPSGKPSLAKGVTIAVTSNERGTAKFTLTVDKATARKLKLDRKAKGPVTVGTGSANLLPGVAQSTTVKLSAKARKALKAGRQVKLLLTVVISDVAGNKATKTLTVTIKNPTSRSSVRG